MDIPQVDPVGCDILIWKLNDEYYFVEVVNGSIYKVNKDMLAAQINSFPEHFTIGILSDGTLGKITPYPLQ